MNHNEGISPEPFGPFLIETDRLVMRPFQISDADFLFALNANPKVLAFTGDAPFSTSDSARRFVEGYTAKQDKGMGRLIVISKSDHRKLGWCGLKQHSGFVDLGFRFLEQEWGQGYATEAAQASLIYAIETLGLHEVTARAMPDNCASLRVLEKLGMQYFKTDSCEGLPGASWFRFPAK